VDLDPPIDHGRAQPRPASIRLWGTSRKGAVGITLHYQLRVVLLKGPNKPDKSVDEHTTIEDQGEHDRDCDYPNEDYNNSSGDFFKFEYLPQIPPKAGNDLIAPPEAENIHSSNCKRFIPQKTPPFISTGNIVLFCSFTS